MQVFLLAYSLFFLLCTSLGMLKHSAVQYKQNYAKNQSYFNAAISIALLITHL